MQRLASAASHRTSLPSTSLPGAPRAARGPRRRRPPHARGALLALAATLGAGCAARPATPHASFEFDGPAPRLDTGATAPRLDHGASAPSFDSGASARSSEIGATAPGFENGATAPGFERGATAPGAEVEASLRAPVQEPGRGAYGGRRGRRPAPSESYPESYGPLHALTLEGSQRIEDEDRAYGLGFYYVPGSSDIGFYVNMRFTAHAGGDPDFTDVFPFNAFGHQVVDEELEAFLINFGVIRPLNESIHLFAGLGFAATAVEVELRDPAGLFGDNGRYYQRRDEDEELNLNIGALLAIDPLAVTVQWDTAFETFSLGVGFTF